MHTETQILRTTGLLPSAQLLEILVAWVTIPFSEDSVDEKVIMIASLIPAIEITEFVAKECRTDISWVSHLPSDLGVNAEIEGVDSCEGNREDRKHFGP